MDKELIELYALRSAIENLLTRGFCEYVIKKDWKIERIKYGDIKNNLTQKITELEKRGGKCTDCEKYDQEKHYCPKFCDVIRDTTKEMQEVYKGEHEKLERIEQIKHETITTLVTMANKLDEVRQIVNNYDGSTPSMIKQFSEIQKVLEENS